MLDIQNVKTYGWEAAIIGMRKPRESLSLSDSIIFDHHGELNPIAIGEKDIALMQQLIVSGGSHRKFLRMIHFSAEMTAPISFWHDFDQYKIGVTTNSEGRWNWLTRHKLTSEKFSPMFSNEHAINDEHLISHMAYLEKLRQKMVCEQDQKEKQKLYNDLCNLLPAGYLQTRQVDLNYEVLFRIYKERKAHPFIEFRQLCEFVDRALPYGKQLISDPIFVQKNKKEER